MRIRRRVVALGLVAGAFLGVLVGVQPSQADAGDVTLTTELVRPADRRVSIRSGPSVSSEATRVVPAGTRVRIDCQLIGGRLGTSSNRDNRTWDRLSDGSFVHDMVTTSSRDGERQDADGGGYAQWTKGVPRCDAPSRTVDAKPEPAAQAADWAAAQVGLSVATAADLAVFKPDSWTPGPVGEWSGDANKFVAAAWAHAHRSVAGDSVRHQYEAYQNRLSQGTPPRGALVFYPGAGDKGHVAISAGDGTVYTTIGADFHYVPISRVALDFFGSPGGWVLP